MWHDMIERSVSPPLKACVCTAFFHGLIAPRMNDEALHFPLHVTGYGLKMISHWRFFFRPVAVHTVHTVHRRDQPQSPDTARAIWPMPVGFRSFTTLTYPYHRRERVARARVVFTITC